MKQICKVVLNGMLCVTIFAATAIGFYNYTPTLFVEDPAIYLQDETISPYAEETSWYFRIKDGVLQRRLWSNTRGIWLTDWIDCN